MLKCVVWDLDDTLWQGILKEKDELHLSQERRELLKAIDQAGILQSIASRNEKEAAEKELKRFGVTEYFLHPQFGMSSKADSIKKIAEALNIGLDTLGFIDDSEFELSEIKYFLPQVRTYHVIRQWEEFLSDIVKSKGNTYESRNRRSMYQAREEREKEEKDFCGNREEFLKECKLVLRVRRGEEEDMERILELARRTNQFKTFSGKVDPDLCRQYLNEKNKALYVGELSDRFGDYGVIGICFAKRLEDVMIVEQFCISCRVEGRGVAKIFLHSLMYQAGRELGTARLQCRFQETDRNLPMLVLLWSMEFRMKDSPAGECLFERKEPFTAPQYEMMSVCMLAGEE